MSGKGTLANIVQTFKDSDCFETTKLSVYEFSYAEQLRDPNGVGAYVYTVNLKSSFVGAFYCLWFFIFVWLTGIRADCNDDRD